MEKQNQDLIEARERLAKKFGDQTRLGAKGTQRRKKKTVQKTIITDDKKLKTSIKKFGVQPLPGIDEVNMFKDDNTVVHFKNPEVLASLQSNTFVVIGNPETKQIKELLPEILFQLGPKQTEFLGQYLKNEKLNLGGKIPEAGHEEEEDVPALVNGNFEDVSKK